MYCYVCIVECIVNTMMALLANFAFVLSPWGVVKTIPLPAQKAHGHELCNDR